MNSFDVENLNSGNDFSKIQCLSDCSWVAICRRGVVDLKISGHNYKLMAGRGILASAQKGAHLDLSYRTSQDAQFLSLDLDHLWICSLKSNYICAFQNLCQSVLSAPLYSPMEFHVSDKCESTLLDCIYPADSDEEAALFREMKMTELLFHLRDIIRDRRVDEKNKDLGLSDLDLAKIRKARGILISNLKDAPKLRELAQMVGTNEKKLSYGFKSLYSRSVHEFLLQRRLNTAYHLIKDKSICISSAAYEVGYTPSYLSFLFRKHYDMSPSDLRKEDAIEALFGNS